MKFDEVFEKPMKINEKESFEPSDIPIVNATINECEKIDSSGEILEGVETFLTEFFNEEIDNTEIFKSEKYGVSFPYTVVSLSEIAQKLFEKSGSKRVETLSSKTEQKSEVHSQKEFIFGTFFNISSAHPYHWVEHGIDQIAKKLPAALEALSRGEKVEDYEVYGVGSPAGELGEVSDDFVDKTKDKPFEGLGEVYAEFVSSLQKQNEKNSVSSDIRLWGVSMGASVAMTTAKSLLENKQAVQSFAEREQLENRKPKVDVVMVSPVATSESSLRAAEIILGFAAEIAIQAPNAYGRNVASAEGDFTSMIYDKLQNKGIEKHLSDEDKRNKNAVLSKAMKEMLGGIPVPKWLNTNEIIGKYDPLMYSNEFRKEANAHEEEFKGSFGQNMVPTEEKNRRKFGINETHTPKVVRENYLKRIIHLGKELNKILATNN